MDASLLNDIWAHVLVVDVQIRVSVTAKLLVYCSPPLITILPTGGVTVCTVKPTGSEVQVLPALSVARKLTIWIPLSVNVAFHVVVYRPCVGSPDGRRYHCPLSSWYSTLSTSDEMSTATAD